VSRRRSRRVTAGTLFLVGGKDGHNKDRALIDRFVRICGGSGARVLVVTSATAKPERHRREYSAAVLESGARDVTIFHVEERGASDDPELLASLDRADGVYFTGGSQRRLVRAMGGTRFEKRLRERHPKGLHVGGTSAGASAMSRVMIASGNGKRPIQPSSVELSTGFGLLPEIIVDQHLRQRGRLNRLIAAVLLHPAMLGFGLDEGTAVAIDSARRAEVFGPGALTVVDGSQLLSDRRWAFAGLRLHVLTAGWRYDLASRKVTSPR
jgi:cyanophycinase